MKVLAINSSPRAGKGRSKTELLLKSLVEGMRQAGAQVEVVNLKEKKVRFCQGCFTCWTKTPGQCILKDDMSQELYPKWLEADLAIYATPLYHFSLNAHMKAFVERTLPFLEPFFERGEGGAIHHPLRHKPPAVVMLSVAGFPEMEVFSQLSSWARFIFREGLLAEIYRPSAEALGTVMGKEVLPSVQEALQTAGRELVESRRVTPETMAAITQPVLDKETIAGITNMFWRTCLENNLTPRECTEANLVPQPQTLEEFLLIMPLGFKAEAAGDLNATIQFNFSGQVEGSCHLDIAGGKVAGASGPAQSPDLAIDAPFALWLEIMSGKADPQQVFMQGQAKAAGDLGLLMRLGQLFGS